MDKIIGAVQRAAVSTQCVCAMLSADNVTFASPTTNYTIRFMRRARIFDLDNHCRRSAPDKLTVDRLAVGFPSTEV